MAMYVRGIKINCLLIATAILFGCSAKDKSFKEKSINQVGTDNYGNIFINACDTFENWKLNNVYSSTDTTYNITFLDSLLCFNKEGTRLISCILLKHSGVNRMASSDGITFFYGEKIDKSWYFFTGPFVVIPRYMVKGHDVSMPLSYEQLHEIALKEVYSGYLTPSGEINEEWFIEQFEGSGWGDFNDQEAMDWALKGKRFKTKKEYFEYFHLQAAIGVWQTRDTTQPIKLLPKKDTLIP